jgi:hypothetical protein
MFMLIPWNPWKNKKTLVDESEDVIDKIGLLELEENDNMLYVIFFIFFSFFQKKKLSSINFI